MAPVRGAVVLPAACSCIADGFTGSLIAARSAAGGSPHPVLAGRNEEKLQKQVAELVWGAKWSRVE